jgi:hypothetical protein
VTGEGARGGWPLWRTVPVEDDALLDKTVHGRGSDFWVAWIWAVRKAHVRVAVVVWHARGTQHTPHG